MSGNNGQARENMNSTMGASIRHPNYGVSKCPKLECRDGVIVKEDSHIYEKVPIKCGDGHLVLVYYRPDTDTYILETIETA